jgi:hypothetical protein
MMELIKKYWVQATVVFLLAVMFFLMYFSVKGDSMIIDEDAHIPAGYSYITTGDYRLNPEHPPLIKDLAGIAVKMGGFKFPYEYFRSNANGAAVNNQWQVGWKFIYEYGNDADALLMWAKVPMILLSLLFGYFVYKWANELYGKKAGILALILFVFNVNMIAHSRFVTTDVGISFAFFVNMYFVYKWLKKPNWRTLLWAGLTFGLVCITKFSAATLVPTYGVIWLMLAFKKSKVDKKLFLEKIYDKKVTNRLWSGLCSFALIGLIGMTLMWLFYVPHTMNMPAQVQKDLIAESGVGPFTKPLQALSDSPITKPLGQWFLGFAMVTAHVQGGHDAFLLGQTSNQGWWYYYPVTIAIKTQIPTFILAFLMFAIWKKLSNRKEWFDEAFLWVLPVVLLLMGMQGKINLGIRYMLPIYAFVFVSMSKLMSQYDLKATWESVKGGVKGIKGKATMVTVTLVVTVSMIWYVLSAILIYPYYLSYFNEFVGGYKNGYHYLTDSNVDWGQDIKRLETYVEKNNIKKIYVDVFPGSMPAKYYLGDRMIEWHVQNGKPHGYFALSATFYQNSRLKKNVNGGMDYSWLDDIEPVANIGGSILIYDLR